MVPRRRVRRRAMRVGEVKRDDDLGGGGGEVFD